MQADNHEFGRSDTTPSLGRSDDTRAIIYGGRLVALAGPRRCYLLTDDLAAAELRFVAAMCLCSREVREGRLAGPFTSELAERWARVFIAAEARARPGVA